MTTSPVPRGRPTMNAGRIAAVAMAALALEVVLGFTVFQGAPEPGLASIAVLPLFAAWAAWREQPWAPVVTFLSALTVVAARSTTLSFDLARPGDLAPFVLAVVTLVTIGIGFSASVVASRPARRTWLAVPGGLAAGAVLGLGLVLGLPQSDDTGGLSDAEVAALPTIEMVDFKFEPGQLRVAEGQRVVFRFANDTGGTHSFAIDALDLDVRVPSGRTRVVVVDAEPGTYPFHCSVANHADDGMKGRLVVAGEDHSDHGNDPGDARQVGQVEDGHAHEH